MRLKARKILPLSVLAVGSSFFLSSVFAQEASLDMIGVSRGIQSKLAVEKAKLNQQQFKSQVNNLESVGDLSSLVVPQGGGAPIPGTPGAPGGGATSLLPTSTEPPASSADPATESSSDPKALLTQYEAEFRQIKNLIVQLGPNYDKLDATQKTQVDGAIKEAVNRLATLDEISKKHPQLAEGKRFAQEKGDISMALPGSGKAFLQGLTGQPDQSFLSKLDQSIEAQKQSQAADNSGENNQENSQGDGNSENTDGGTQEDGTGTEGDSDEVSDEKPLSPEEALQAACTANIGGKDGGPTLLKHLSKGDCAKAIEENAEYSGKFKIGKIKSLLKEWQNYGVNSATLNIGIHALAELGIHVYPDLSQSQVPAVPVDEAVSIQQEQKLVSQTSQEPKGAPKKTQSSGDRPILNSSNATD